MSQDPPYDFEVLIHFLPAIVNGDPLEDERDERLLQEFLDDQGHHWGPVYDPEFPDDLIQYMGRCDITGLIGWVVQIVKH